MANAIFCGLVFDEADQPLAVTYLGADPYYVLDDQGFQRHIPAGDVDRQIFFEMTSHVKGNEDMLSEQAAKMMGAGRPVYRGDDPEPVGEPGKEFPGYAATWLAGRRQTVSGNGRLQSRGGLAR